MCLVYVEEPLGCNMGVYLEAAKGLYPKTLKNVSNYFLDITPFNTPFQILWKKHSQIIKDLMNMDAYICIIDNIHILFKKEKQLHNYKNDLPLPSLFHMKITVSVTKSLHQDWCCSHQHVPTSFFYIHSSLLWQNEKLMLYTSF